MPGARNNDNQRSAVVAGFLETARNILKDDASRRRIAEAMTANAGPAEPIREEQRREALAKWTTHRWAPTALQLAGYGELANRLRQCEKAEDAADILAYSDYAVPTHRNQPPRDLEEIAGQVCMHAAQAGHTVIKATGPAYAAYWTCEAARLANANGIDVVRLNVADEIVNAAQSAMRGDGPEPDEMNAAHSSAHG